MHLLVKRKWFYDTCTIGELYVDDSFEAYTLEDTMREVPGVPVAQWKVPGKTAIPVGTYPVITTFSERFQRVLPLLLQVPGFEGVRLHNGNFDTDTEGCLLLGLERGDRCVLSSRSAVAVVQPLIQKALDANNPVTITITNEGA